MQDLSENNIVKFTNISQKKNTLIANFKVKGIKNGVTFTASLSVDLSVLELHSGDSIENIVEKCAKYAVKQFTSASFLFEGLDKLSEQYLGVAQLG